MFKNMTIGTKMAFGFGLITLVLTAAVLTTIWKVGESNKVNNKIIELRAPTAQASLSMLNGMNHSLAALRGWIILGKDKFKDERTGAWSKEIEPAMAEMKNFAVNWTNQKNVERLNIIEEKLADFKVYQQEIENIAQSIDNTPALKLLFEEAAPQAGIMVSNIIRLIDLEADQTASADRKALLGMMADVRGTTGLALANIRAYLLSGNEKFKEKFDKLWTRNVRRFGDLSDSAALLTPEQVEAFTVFSSAREIFSPLPPKMFEIRRSNEWNLANLWLGTKAVPTGFAIKEQLDGMVTNQQQLMATDVATAKSLAASLINLEWLLPAGGLTFSIIITVFLPKNITRQITEPIKKVVMELTSAFSELTAAAGQISGSSQSLSEGSTEQASSLEETSATMEEMASVTKQNANNAKEAAGVVNMCSTSAERGAGLAGKCKDDLQSIVGDVRKAVDTTKSSLQGIVDNVKKSATLTNEISNASTEQSEGIDQVNCAMQQMDQVTQQNAASAEETASASEEMTAQVQTLREQVDILAKLVGYDVKKRVEI